MAVAEHKFCAFESAPHFVTSHSDLIINDSQGEKGKEFNASENG